MSVFSFNPNPTTARRSFSRSRVLAALVMALVGSVFAITPAQAAAAADVGVNISAPSFPVVGANFDFTIKVTNHGPNAATGVYVTDSLPTGLVTFQAVSSSDPTDTCTGTSYISCSLGSLVNGETTTILVTVRRDSSAQAYDYANVTSDADSYTDNNSDYVVIQQPLSSSLPADVAITMQAPASPDIGTAFDYTITVTNFGPNPATNVKVTDNLNPSYVTFSSVTPINCSYLTSGSNPRVACYFDSLGNGNSVVITLTVKRVSGYQFSNSAYVASDADPNGNNNSAFMNTSADPSVAADMGITAQAPSVPPVGSNFDLTLTATNHGPSRATSVNLYAYVYSQVSFVSVTPGSACGYSSPNQSVNCTFPSIDNGASVTITVTLKRVTGGPFQLYSNVYSNLDLNPQNNNAQVSIGPDLAAAADVGVTVHTPPSPATGSTFAYTIDVTNHGPNTATGVYLDDTLPSQVSFVSASIGCLVYGSTVVECSVGSLANAATYHVVITVKRLSGKSFQNTADVFSDVDLNNANDSDFATVNVDPGAAADVGVVMAAPSSPGVGSAFSYTIVVTNHGPATATNVRMDDVLPAQVSFQSAAPLSACSYLNGATKVSCNIGTMTNGASITLSISVIRNASGTFTNTARLTSDLDLNAANDTSSVSAATAPMPLQVSVSDAGFSPMRTNAWIGKAVQWHFNGTSNQSVTDSTGMGLFDSSVRSTGESYSFLFFGAGTFPYKSSVNPSLTGSVVVPLRIARTSGSVSTTFTVTWASSAPPPGYVFQIQKRNPGSTAWTTWLSNQTGLSTAFIPGSGTGAYSFRARLKKSGGPTSWWSPTAWISVS